MALDLSAFGKTAPQKKTSGQGVAKLDFSAFALKDGKTQIVTPRLTVPSLALNQNRSILSQGPLARTKPDFNSVSISGIGSGETLRLAKLLPGAASTAAIDFARQEEERRARESLAQEALTELVERPAQIARFVSVDIPVSFWSGMGKTLNELIASASGDRFNEAMGMTKEEVDAFYDKSSDLFGVTRTDSWQEIGKKITAYMQQAPAAQDWEKKYLGPLVAITGFVSDFFTPGKGKISGQLLKDLAASTDLAENIAKMKAAGIPDEVAQAAGLATITATKPEQVDAVIRRASASIARQGAEALKAKPEPLRPGYMSRAAQTKTAAPATQATKPTIKRAVNLPPQLRQIEEDAVKMVESNEAELIQEYRNANGNMINTDEARELFPAYRDDRSLSSAVHEPASYLTKRVFDDMLETEKGVGNNTVLFSAGGTGAGKSYSLRLVGKDLKKYSVVYDTNMNTLDSSIAKIEKSLANGYKVEIAFVYNDILRALDNALDRAERMAKELGTGRTVPIEEHMKTHLGSIEVLRKLMEKYAKNTKIGFQVIDNSGETLKKAQDMLAFLDDKRYNGSYEELQRQLEARVRERLADGTISERTAKGFLNESPDSSGKRGSPSGSDSGKGERPGIQKEGSGVLDRAASQNLIKEISKEEAAGPIADLLVREFPNVSRKTLDIFGARLSRLKRTGDIEGHLQTLKRFSKLLAARTPKEAVGAINKITKDATRSVPTEDAAQKVLGTDTAKLLSKTERIRYKQLSEEILNDKQRSVLAQQEYDTLYEYLNQRVVDRYEELMIQRDVLKDVLDSSVGKEINKLYSGTFLSPDDVGIDELIAQRPGKNIDSKVSEIMQGQIQPGVADTVEQAQKAFDDWKSTREVLQEVRAEMREIRPKAQAAKMLSPILEDVPVIARDTAGAIDVLTEFDRIRNGYYRDISGTAKGFKDLWRNFERFFGKYYDEAKALVLDPFDDSKGAMVDELAKIGKELEEGVTKKFGIKKWSAMDAAIMRYGDTSLEAGERFTYDKLVEKFGRAKADNIVAADAWFRETYNRLIDEVNVVRKEIYPHRPDKMVAKRKDYYRHFSDMGQDFRGIYDILFEQGRVGIDPELAGISSRTKPLSKWLSFAQQRKGAETDISAIAGFVDYANAFAFAKHIDPHVGKFRYLRRKLTEYAKTPGTKDIDGRRVEGMNNFLEYLDEFANNLAGKSNEVDRWIQSRIPGGRIALKTMNWITGRAKGSAVVTAGGVLAQALNLPQVIASSKIHFLSGLKDSFAARFGAAKPFELTESTFYRERYAKPLELEFKSEWVSGARLKRTEEEIRDFTRFIMQSLDRAVVEASLFAHYRKAIAEGIDEPLRYAEDMTRRNVAGRGIGEVPLDQQGKIIQLLLPFQIEVMNSWWRIGDFIRKKDTAALITFLASAYLLNEAMQNVRGSRGSYDPINALVDGYANAEDEWGEGNYNRATSKFLGRQLGEAFSNVIGGQYLAAIFTDDFVKKTTGMEKREFFGEGDPGRFGSPILISPRSASDIFYKLIGPGGKQAEKTINAIRAMATGEVDTKAGKLNYEVEPTPRNIIQAVLFGINATPEAQKIFDKNDDLFQRQYRQEHSRNEFRMAAETEWAKIKKMPDKEARKKRIAEIRASDPKMIEEFQEIKNEEKLGLTSTDRLIKMLGVENGERAKYIYEEMQGMKKEERLSFIKELRRKKILTDRVAEQVAILKKTTTVSE